MLLAIVVLVFRLTCCALIILMFELSLVLIGTFLIMLVLVFFFSSRRRHTRFDCDWSSDVCSSDLAVVQPELVVVGAVGLAEHTARVARKQERELVVLGPRRERLDRVRADPDEDHAAPVVKQLCVLITVRMHLDRSALGSRLVEEGEDDRFALEIA